MGGELNKLSDKKLKNLLGIPREKYEFFADGAGLSVRVSTVGGISWTFTYRNSGTIQRVTLGRYPDMSLKRAREKRDECRTWLSEGKDPRRQLKLTKQESLKPVTVKDALDYWVEHYAMNNRTDIDSRSTQLKKHIYPYIGDMALSDCETRYWLQCFDRMKKRFR
ncbi:Prophage integrase IntS [Sodalis praecaptivus]